MSERTKLSILLEPNDEETTSCRCEIQGSSAGLLAAYEQLSVHLFKELEESKGADFMEAMYAVLQMKIIEDVPGLHKSFKNFEKANKAAKALSSILGKTFTMPSKEDEE